MDGDQQMLHFQPGLTVQYPRFRDVLVNAVYSHRKGLNGVAADIDMSPSDLSKRLSSEPGDQRPLRDTDLIGILESTQDLRPIYWLIEKYMESPETRKARAVDQLATILPSLLELARQAGLAPKKGR